MDARARGLILGVGLVSLAGALACERNAVPTAQASRGAVFVVTVQGAIGPATASYVSRGISRAAEHEGAAVILQIDTPGGLDTSMRAIARDILASPVPVAGFVAPRGARAASAGTFIMYATHVAAMAPGTNMGAATPVQLGGAEPADEAAPAEDTDPAKSKTVNDAVAYIRSLAELRGRNAEWAERAVREAASLSAQAALAAGVVELLATDVDDLIAKLDGRRVDVGGVKRVLRTADAPVVPIEPSWSNQLLAAVTDPNIAMLLMLIGVWGVIFELANPGSIFPGVLGGVCLLLGLYALHVLPVNWAGMGLIVLGIALMVAEAFAPSFGVLGIGGIAAFIAGGFLLLESDVPGFQLSPWVIFVAAAASAAFFGLVLRYVLRTRRRAVVTGREGLEGSVGTVLSWADSQGVVWVAGERWRAVSSEPMKSGQEIEVKSVEHLVLSVVPKRRHLQEERPS